MRLIDHLATQRQTYKRVLPTLPDVLLIDIPPEYAGTGLPLDRYYPVIIETDAEWAEMQTFLAAKRPAPVAPALFDRRPSALQTTSIVIARYRPPAPGWPWLLLCCWPRIYSALVPDGSDFFARETYTTEVFESRADLEEQEAILIANLAPIEPVKIDGIFPGL